MGRARATGRAGEGGVAVLDALRGRGAPRGVAAQGLGARVHAPCVGKAAEVPRYSSLEALSSGPPPNAPPTPTPHLPRPPTPQQFNSTNKWQLSIHRPEDPDAQHPLLVLKGAPERVLRMCTHIMVDGQSVPLDADMQRKYNEGEHRAGPPCHHLGCLLSRIIMFCLLSASTGSCSGAHDSSQPRWAQTRAASQPMQLPVGCREDSMLRASRPRLAPRSPRATPPPPPPLAPPTQSCPACSVSPRTHTPLIPTPAPQPTSRWARWASACWALRTAR